ncbi:MAG: phosphoadenosine phosphosulfate reductase family protein [Chloroflexota bacterium]|nr:phosphoadenosine phosphosulfate reductase family protein [Chloroflexota bacterium]
MAHILSFGAGVNTVALMVLLVEEGEPLDGVVFADTGGETPATYDSLEIAKKYLENKNVPFTIVKARPRKTDLYGTASRRRVIPSVQWRWCTRDFKVNPIHKYYSLLGEHINQYIGIAYDEVHRMKDSREEYITNIYPLIEKRMTRDDCIDVIGRAGLPVPEKSGCYFCPFNSTERWLQLLTNHPNLFEKAIALEENSKHFPNQRLTDQVFRERDRVTLREYRDRLTLGNNAPQIPEGMVCGGYCMT